MNHTIVFGDTPIYELQHLWIITSCEHNPFIPSASPFTQRKYSLIWIIRLGRGSRIVYINNRSLPRIPLSSILHPTTLQRSKPITYTQYHTTYTWELIAHKHTFLHPKLCYKSLSLRQIHPEQSKPHRSSILHLPPHKSTNGIQQSPPGLNPSGDDRDCS